MIRRFIPNIGVFSTELRFLRAGDIFWYEKDDEILPIPGTSKAKIAQMRTFYFVAVGEPIWKAVGKTKREFVGMRYREAIEPELYEIAKYYNQIILSHHF